ncbi:MAG: hypothetical protein ACQUHE_07350 [Bacteroidia bacterium]
MRIAHSLIKLIRLNELQKCIQEIKDQEDWAKYQEDLDSWEGQILFLKEKFSSINSIQKFISEVGLPDGINLFFGFFEKQIHTNMQDNNSNFDETMSVSTDVTVYIQSASQKALKDLSDMVQQAVEKSKQLETMLFIITSVIEHDKSS